jgi:hypothetical protein
MSKFSRRPLTCAIQRALCQSAMPFRSVPKYAVPSALLTLLLLNQPALGVATFVELPREENPLGSPPIDRGRNSKLVFADIDNDRDLDAFIGGEEDTVRYYENTGTINQPRFVERVEQNNPLNSMELKNSSPTFVDIDNDGDLDTFIGAGDGTVKYYENTGTVNNPIFSERTEQKNSLNDVDVGDASSPILVDIDNDNDLDAFIGGSVVTRDDDGEIITSYGIVKYYENTGNISHPIFKERTDANNPWIEVEKESKSSPYFADIDNDNDLDVFIGNSKGKVEHYENTGNVNQPLFVERIEQQNPFNDVDVVSASTPTLVDIDHDGDLDAFIGGKNGTISIINYYENTGDVTQPLFIERIGQNNPFGGVGAGRIPVLADIDNDADLDVFTGNLNGRIRYYKNTGTIHAPTFVNITGQHNPLYDVEVGEKSFPCLVDIDNDGDIDAFVGADDGTIKYYENTGSASHAIFIERTEQNNPFDSVDIGSVSSPTLADIDNDHDLDAFIGTEEGKISYYKNMGTINQPIFVEQRLSNPLSSVNVGEDSILTLVDVDYDGNLDALIGASSGTLKYYENIGNTSQPDFEHMEQNNPFNDINVFGSALSLGDIDNNGDLDAFIGIGNRSHNWVQKGAAPSDSAITVGNGPVKYYKNTGDVNQISFIEHSEQSNPLAIDNVPLVSKVTLVDFDNDNDLDAFVNLPPISQLSLADVDNDNNLEAVVKVANGTVVYYENMGTVRRILSKLGGSFHDKTDTQE